MHSPRFASEFSSCSLPYIHHHGTNCWELAAAAWLISSSLLTVRGAPTLMLEPKPSKSNSSPPPPPRTNCRSPPKRNESRSLMFTSLPLLSLSSAWSSPLSSPLSSQLKLSSSCLPSPSSSSPSQSLSWITLNWSALKAKSPPWTAKVGSKSRTPTAVWEQPVLAEGLTPTVWIELSPPPVTLTGWLTSPVSQSCSVSWLASKVGETSRLPTLLRRLISRLLISLSSPSSPSSSPLSPLLSSSQKEAFPGSQARSDCAKAGAAASIRAVSATSNASNTIFFIYSFSLSLSVCDPGLGSGRAASRPPAPRPEKLIPSSFGYPPLACCLGPVSYVCT